MSTLTISKKIALSLLLVGLFTVASPAVSLTPVAHATCIGGEDDITNLPCSDAGAGPSTTTGTPPTLAGGGAGTGANTGGLWGTVMTTLASLFAVLTGAAGITLDNAVYYTVVTMGGIINGSATTGGLPSIGVAWHVLRDIGNIVLIFGFLAIGICTILNVDWYGGGTKMLPHLLIAAVFINFSFFISEAVIDTGNLFASQIYQQINGGQPVAAVDFTLDNIHQEGISSKIMSQLGLQTFYGNAITNQNVLSSNNPFLLGFLSILLFIVAAFVMFSLAFILIARFVILLFLIIVAPIGFAGYAVPKLEGAAHLWWKTLVDQTITAPILLLMLYVALSVITDGNFLRSFGSDAGTDPWTGWLTGADGGVSNFAGAIISFFIAMGLLLACTILAKRLSAFGGDWATGVGAKITGGFVGYGVSGGASVLGRVGLGGLGLGLSNKYMKAWADRQAKNGPVRGLAASLVVGSGKLLASRTYDARNSSLVKKGGGALAGVLGSVAGDSGAADIVHSTGSGVHLTAAEAHEEKFGIKPIKEIFKKAAEDNAKAASELDFKKAQAAMETADADLLAGTITPAQYDLRVKALTDGFAKMSTKQLTELGGIKKGVAALVKNLSPQQFEAVMKSDLGEKEKANIRKGRFGGLQNEIDTALALPPGPPRDAALTNARGNLAKLTTKEFVYADKNFLASNFVADNMTDDQYEAVGKEGILTAAQKAGLDKRRKDKFDPTASPAAVVADNLKATKWNQDKLKKIPANAITNAGVLNALGADAIDLIDAARRMPLTRTEKALIGTFLSAATTTAGPHMAAFLTYYNSDPRIKRDLFIP